MFAGASGRLLSDVKLIMHPLKYVIAMGTVGVSGTQKQPDIFFFGIYCIVYFNVRFGL